MWRSYEAGEIMKVEKYTAFTLRLCLNLTIILQAFNALSNRSFHNFSKQLIKLTLDMLWKLQACKLKLEARAFLGLKLRYRKI
jgi:hypothetical protein